MVCLLGVLLAGCEMWQAADSTNVYIEVKEQIQEMDASALQNGVEATVDEGQKEQDSAMDGNTGEENIEASAGAVTSEEILEEIEEKPGKEYFSDALFIGDSRTAGLREYGSFEDADYFATPGLSIYSVPKTKVTIQDYEDITLDSLLEKKEYGKIYLMLGINELGYRFEQTVERYREFVEGIQEKEPGAVLYLCANLHVTITRSENDAIYNNQNIDKMNEEIRKLAEEKGLHYLDVNELYDDENGNLNEEYASDDSHVLAKYYELWCEWLVENIRE